MEHCQFCGNPRNEEYSFCNYCGGKAKPDSKTIANLDILQKKIEQDSLNPQHYLALGDLYLENNAVTLALEQFHKALALKEKDVEIYLKIGKAQNLLENNREALIYLHKAFEIDKTNREIVRGLALIYFSAQDWEKAINACKAYLKHTEDLDLLVALAKSYREKGQIENAIQTYERISAKKDAPVEILAELAQLYEQKKEHDKLIEIREKLFEAKKDELSLIDLAKAYISAKIPQKAVDLIAKSGMPTRKSIADYYLSLAYLSLDNIGKAKELLQALDFKHLDISDEEKKLGTDLLLKTGDTKYKADSFEEAIPWYSFAFDLNPQDEAIAKRLAETYKLAANSYQESHQMKAAESYFIKASEILTLIGSDPSSVNERLAEIIASRGEEFLGEEKLKDALSEFLEAQQFAPNVQPLFDTTGHKK